MGNAGSADVKIPIFSSTTGMFNSLRMLWVARYKTFSNRSGRSPLRLKGGDVEQIQKQSGLKNAVHIVLIDHCSKLSDPYAAPTRFLSAVGVKSDMGDFPHKRFEIFSSR